MTDEKPWINFSPFDKFSWPKPWTRIFVDFGPAAGYRFAWGYLDFAEDDAPIFVFDIDTERRVPFTRVRSWREETKKPGSTVVWKYRSLAAHRQGDAALIRRLKNLGVRV